MLPDQFSVGITIVNLCAELSNLWWKLHNLKFVFSWQYSHVFFSSILPMHGLICMCKLFLSTSVLKHMNTWNQESSLGTVTRWQTGQLRYYSLHDFRLLPQVDENCVLLGYYATSSGNSLPTFRDNLSLPSSRGKNPTRKLGGLQRGLYREECGLW